MTTEAHGSAPWSETGNVVAMLAARVQQTPHATAIRHYAGHAWHAMSWQALWDDAAALAEGLHASYGPLKGQPIVIHGANSAAFVLADIATAMLGAVSVPVHPDVAVADLATIVSDCDPRLVCCDAPALFEQASAPVVSLLPGPTPNVADILAKGRKAGQTCAQTQKAQLRPSDRFCLLYTSGTTGTPKGVALSHGNLLYESWAMRTAVQVDTSDELLLVLPLGHVFARTLAWAAIDQGATLAIATRELPLEAQLQTIAPTYMAVVPTLLRQLRKAIVQRFAKRDPVTRELFWQAVRVGRDVSQYVQRGDVVPLRLALQQKAANRVVLRRIHAAFGGRLRFLVSGAAATSLDSLEFFHALGILVLEGYGLTETSGATHVNRPERFRFGTVGPALPGCETMLAHDGEVLIRGPNMMMGYHHRPSDTDAVIDSEGWLHTGDLGELESGFLKIVGRKKDLFKLESGKSVAPSRMEARLRTCHGIARALVFGDGLPHVLALIELDLPTLLVWSQEERLGCRSYQDLAAHPALREHLRTQIERVNRELPRFAAVADFAVLDPPPSQNPDLVTSTGAFRRRMVLARYAAARTSLVRRADPELDGPFGSR